MKIILGLANVNQIYRGKKLNIDGQGIVDLLSTGTIDGLDTAESYGNFALLKDIGMKVPSLDLTSKIHIRKYPNPRYFKDLIWKMSDIYKVENGFNLLVHDSSLDKFDEWKKLRNFIEEMLNQKIIRSFGLSAYLPYELDYFRRLFPFASTFQIPRNPLNQKLRFFTHEPEGIAESRMSIYYRSIFAGGDFLNISKNLKFEFPELSLLIGERGISEKDFFIDFFINYQKCFPKSCVIIGANDIDQIIQTSSKLRQDRHERSIVLENFLLNYSGNYMDLRRKV